MINWNVSKAEHKLIIEIANRARGMAVDYGLQYPIQEIVMDITATHANGCPLKLGELAGAAKFDFVHDVFGIYRHINRQTGQLEDSFLPRYADTGEVTDTDSPNTPAGSA